MSCRFSSLRTGPKLAKRLAQVELASLPDEAVLDYLHAEVKQLASQQARVWAAMAEVHRRAVGVHAHEALWTAERVFGSAACEISCELRVSELSAKRELQRADDLEALPTVAAALRAGEIDRTRVVVLLDVCFGLSDAHRDQLIAHVLPGAGAVPPAKLREQAQHAAIALDPDWAERRYRDAVRRRRVVRYLNDDGTVTIAAEDQDAADALAAYARLTALAKAAKHAGAHASMDTLRSIVSIGLQGHRFAGMHERDIIAQLVAEFPKPTPEAPGEDIVAAEPADLTAAEPTGDEPTDDVPTEPEPTEPEPTEPEPIPAHAQPSEEPPADELSAEEEYYEAELLADELLGQGFFDDEQCTRAQRAALLDIALAMTRRHARRPRTDQDPDPPPF